MITAISDLATRKIAGKQYLAPKQLAELLGVRLSSIYEWDAAGALPKRMQVGRRFFYAAEDVDNWFARRQALGNIGKPE
jgi:excisionase family DNA binding protein